MGRTRIKICGITSVADALAAAGAGADALGLVLGAQAKRRISLEVAREIVAAVPAMVSVVGLFVDQEPGRVRDMAMELGLRDVQLHGEETPEQVAGLSPLRVLKAIRVRRETLGEDLSRWRQARRERGLSNLVGVISG